MRKWNETVEVSSIFGKIKLEYIAAKQDEFSEMLGGPLKNIPSYWQATILDGDYNGWTITGRVESVAMKNLLVMVSKRYAADLQDQLDDVDISFTGGPEDG